MKPTKLLLTFMLLFCGVYFSCNKEDNVTLPRQISATFSGQIVDESGHSVYDAEVKAGGKTVRTDRNGVFRLEAVQVDSRAAVIQVKKPGYFEFSRAYFMQKDVNQSMTIMLIRKDSPTIVSTSAGGVVKPVNGVSINFPSNSVVDERGEAYKGNFLVYAHYFNPSDPELYLSMPGDLRAVDSDEKEAILATFGMVAVEIEGESGQKLQLALGKEAEIIMPVPADKSAAAPDQIALWYYHVETARWIEEGAAIKSGNQYIGKVRHFSFWNIDAPFETIDLEGKVFIRNAQTPLVKANIRLTMLSNGFQGFAVSNQEGWFGGLVPKDVQMKLEVLFQGTGACYEEVFYSQMIGPFSENTVLPDIIVDMPVSKVMNLNGSLLDCSGQPLTNGYAIIYAGTTYPHVCFPDANGNIRTEILYCNDNLPAATVIAHDLTTLRKSEEQSFSISPGNIELGTISTCKEIVEYLEFTLDGHSVLFENPTLLIQPYDSLIPTVNYRTTIYVIDAIMIKFISENDKGIFPMQSLFIEFPAVWTLNGTPRVKVSVAPANIGDMIVGTFEADYGDFLGNPHSISGSYRIKRTQ